MVTTPRPRGWVAPEGRHPATVELLGWFAYEHLPEDLQAVSRPLGDLARHMVDTLPDGPELTTGLRKLLEAKDCFVRQGIKARERVES